jgi:hypothetical protein
MKYPEKNGTSIEVSAIKTVFLNDFLILEKSISNPARNIRNMRPKDEKNSKRALSGIISNRDCPIIMPIMSSITITGSRVYLEITGAMVMASRMIISTIVDSISLNKY